MNCPECGTEYQCPCDSCVKRKPSKWTISNTSDDGNNWDETCPGCGKTESIYVWLGFERENSSNIISKKQ